MLLGRGRAAERAHARADAAARVAAQVAARPAERLRAAAGDRGVAPGQLGSHLGDRQRPFDARKAGIERLSRKLLQAVLLPPALEHRRRRAKAGARVDQRRAAEAAAERQQDRRRAQRGSLAAVAVQPRRHLDRPRGEAVGVVARALLEHDDLRASLGELGRHDRPARAGAGDAYVGLDRSGIASRPPLCAAQRASAARRRRRRPSRARGRPRGPRSAPSRAERRRADPRAAASCSRRHPRRRRAERDQQPNCRALRPRPGRDEALEHLRASLRDTRRA